MNSDQKVKVCNKCKKKLPATLEYFYKNNSKSGLYATCKKCISLRDKKKREEKRKMKYPFLKEGYKICTKCKKQFPKTNEYFRIKKKKQNRKDGSIYICVYFEPSCLECEKQAKKEYCEKNSEKIKIWKKRDYLKHHKENLEIRKKWRKNNRDKLNIYFRNKRQEDVQYNLREKLSKRIRDTVKNNKKTKSNLELLGCSVDEFKNYFGSLFTEGMTWRKFMNGEIHIDHKNPCSFFDLSIEEQQKECFHYSNLQPLWAEENLKKNDKIEDDRLFFIADISSNFEGSLEKAYAHIKSAAEAGATAVKFQAFLADKLINKERFEKLGNIGHQKEWGMSVFDIYRKYELNREWIPKLYRCCKENGVHFMCTPYDLEAVDLLEPYIRFQKIGSGDINYFPLLEKVAKSKKPILFGCGAADFYDIKKAYETLSINNNKVIPMQCNSNYTGNDEENMKYLNLKVIETLKKYFGKTGVGLSDHTRLENVILGAIILGARWIERHYKICDNQSPDSKFSMNPMEWRKMIEVAEKAMNLLGYENPIITNNQYITRCIQRRDKRTNLRPDMEWYDKYLKKK